MTVNKALLLGHLESDPVITALPTGTRVANFVLVTIERWKDGKTGQEKNRNERHKIAVFSDKLIDMIQTYISAGTMVYIEGQIETRNFTDSSGASRATIDIVVRPNRGALVILGENDEQRHAQPAFV